MENLYCIGYHSITSIEEATFDIMLDFFLESSNFNVVYNEKDFFIYEISLAEGDLHITGTVGSDLKTSYKISDTTLDAEICDIWLDSFNSELSARIESIKTIVSNKRQKLFN